MTSAPVRDPLADHLLTPQNAALLVIDYQPSQLAGARRPVDRSLHGLCRARRGARRVRGPPVPGGRGPVLLGGITPKGHDMTEQ
jgi:hypothetical protein